MNSKTITLAAAIGMFMSTLDTGIINIAIPVLIKDFHTTLSFVSMTVTGYTLALCISILLFGVLADRFGRVKIYLYGLWLFSLSSLLCALSTSIMQLVIFRALQGLGAAMLQATAISLVTTLIAPEHRNKSLGIVIMFAGSGPVIGPAIGGFLISIFGWQAIFLINIPICLLGIALCRKFKEKPNKLLSTINGGSLAVIIFFVASVIVTAIALSNKFIPHIVYQVGCVMIVLSIIVLLVHELKSSTSILPASILLNPNVITAMLGLFVMGFSTVMVFMLPPIYLMHAFGFAPYQVGIVALLAPLSMMVASNQAHKVIKRLGTKYTLSIGLGLIVTPLAVLSVSSMMSHLAYLCLMLVVFGAGCGLLQPSATILLMSEIEQSKHSVFTSLSRMQVNIAIALGAAFVAIMLPEKTMTTINIHYAWEVALVIAAFVLLLSWVIYMSRKIRLIKSALD
ncbi:MFS transporter [Facilibium subflavum]|uniref:MFS transporter n=1 Tax=Facilibium subflavum TaxID=2219058 RepID=UPI000E6552BD|nr:MFS transporter [Facilibium subflavum]